MFDLQCLTVFVDEFVLGTDAVGPESVELATLIEAVMWLFALFADGDLDSDCDDWLWWSCALEQFQLLASKCIHLDRSFAPGIYNRKFSQPVNWFERKLFYLD